MIGVDGLALNQNEGCDEIDLRMFLHGCLGNLMV